MNIQTKFNIGDKVCTIDKKTMKVKAFVIGSMSVYVSKNDSKPSVNYRSSDDGYTGDSHEEEFCFPNETELLSYITTKELKK